MRALVTGGAGFIGSHLVDALVERGDDVVAVDDLSTGRRENLEAALAEGARLIEASIVDRAALTDLFGEHPPQAVYHLAAQIDVRVSVADPRYDLDLNVGGTIELLELARAHGVGRFHFASTGGAIYGEGEGRKLPLREDAECRPDAPYGLSKYAAECYIELYRRVHGLSTTVLRLANVYGPRQDPHGEAGVVAIFCGKLRDGETPRVFGDGKQTRDYVYVADVVDAFLAAERAGTNAAGPYNVGTGNETSVLELGERLGAVADRPFDPEMAPHRPGEVQRIAIDPSRAEEELGWSAMTDLDRGLARTYAWSAERV